MMAPLAAMGRRLVRLSLPLATVLAAAAHAENAYTVPLFHAVGNENGQGFVRILNASNTAGTVSIDAWDDEGRRFGPVELAIGAGGVRQFNSDDLEDGNESKGLTGRTGSGQGDWRLELTTELDLIVLAFVRTADGFLTSVHDTVRGQWDERQGLHVYPARIFNPGSNTRQASVLRIVNPNARAQRVTLRGRADDGVASPIVAFDLAANASRTLSAEVLESGDAPGLTGALGNGQGKWELYAYAARPLIVMSLLRAATGHITNLSSEPIFLAPRNAEEFAARTAGKLVQASSGAPGYSVRFSEAGFTERVSASVMRRGTYQYTPIGPRSGFVQLSYEGEDGGHCAVSVIFSTQTSGRLLSVCGGGASLDINWRLIDE